MKRLLVALLALLTTSSLFAQSSDPCPQLNAFDTIAFCDGDSVLYHGNWYFLPGDYADTLYDAYGCMTIYHLHITFPTNIFPAPARARSRSYRTLCEGDSVLVAGVWVKQSGVYFDTLRASYGCDSIDTVFVNFYPVYQHFDTISTCDSAFYHGQYYTAAGNYTIYYQSTSGCDSIYHLHLMLFASSHDTIHIDTCQDAIPIIVNGKHIYESGIYTDTLLSYSYCDSIVTYIVNFFPSYTHSDTLILCEGDEYEFCGYTYYATRSGTYICGAKSVHGCDSTIRLCLTVIDCNSTSTPDNASLYDITLLPNPTSTTDIAYLYADFPDDQLDGMLVEVMTPTGVILNSIRPTQFPLAIPAINAPGTYFVRITTSSGVTHIRKLLVH